MEPTYETFGDAARLVRITNTANPVPDDLRETIDQRRAGVLQSFREQEQLKNVIPHQQSRPTGMLQRALDDFARQPANRGLIESVEAWERERRARLDEIRSSPRTRVQQEQPRFEFDVRQPRVAGEGELWWAETTFILPDRLGLHLFWDAQGLRLAGSLRYSSGDLWKGSLVIFSWFGLSRDRMPGGGTRFRSSPVCWLTGEVMGNTYGGGIFAGDQWCKCWLQASQVVHQGSLALPAWAQHYTVMHIDSDFSYDTNFLPGFVPFPSIDFDLNRQLDVAVYTGLKFDFQLEGDVEFTFGGIGHQNPSLFQGSQWRLQPL